MKNTKLMRSNLQSIVHRLSDLFAACGWKRTGGRIPIILIDLLLTWVTCEGRPGLKRFKELSNFAVRQIMGLRTKSNFPYKYPRVFQRAVELSGYSHMDALYWISVLNIYRQIELSPEFDVSTITGKYEGRFFGFFKQLWDPIKSTCDTVRESLGIQPMRETTLRWSISGSSGPNGPLAYSWFIDDVYAVRRSWLKYSLLSLYLSLPVKNWKEVSKVVSNLFRWVRKNPSRRRSKNPIHSRLAFLKDKGGKTRVVAIVDILSQSILKPVHDRISSLLKLFEADGTFDQDKQRRRVQSWTKDNTFLSSIDLSACTDRFPCFLQAVILWRTGVLTPWQAVSWLLVMTRRTFVYCDNGTVKHLRYRVGQPMGALSSWPAMAFSHHVLVQLAYKRSYPKSKKIFSGYALLGDDLVIRDKSVAEAYKEIIAFFGMPWSPSKSFECVGRAEFAKSLFRRGEDLKPFPLSILLYRNDTCVTDVIALVAELSYRGFRLNFADFVDLYGDQRWRKLVTCAALSPSSIKTCFLDQLHGQEVRDNIFESVLLRNRIRMFDSSEKVGQYIGLWAWHDPTNLEVMGNPYVQIGQDASNRYPVRRVKDEDANLDPNVLVGWGWTAYDPVCWPEGLPNLQERDLIPGPSWRLGRDDVIFRSTLKEMDSLIPGYFWPCCFQRSFK